MITQEGREPITWNNTQDRQYVAWLDTLATTYRNIVNRLGFRTGNREFLANALMLYGIPHDKCASVIVAINKHLPSAQSYDP